MLTCVNGYILASRVCEMTTKEKRGPKMRENSKQDFILTGNMYKVIGTLALPIMINNLIQTLYNLVDGVWVSKIGSVPFAATAFVWPINFLFVSIGGGLAIAGTSLIAQFMGADDKEQAKRYATQLLVLSVVAGLLFAGIGFLQIGRAHV